MNSRDLMKDELQLLYSLIEGIEIRYEFKKSISTHFIEVKPLDLFDSNKLYIEMEIELEDKFSKLFPNEDLVFISQDSLSKIGNPDLILSFKIDNPDLILPFKINYKQENKSINFDDDLFKGFEMEVNSENNYALAA